ncbi:hypothetical protein [Blastopirellula marina]|uniref:Uncharacterized protein n=1 Tax=Blastopirellula marina DSM 3645 TaxID=314230 RepID=A3ZUR9_9BACT|nr:hypothetical protein [Blastopirellula marina]EAQ79655.1 hypothetical protein DSM3645_24140 [Blastopirellula marina DSM 3645]
MTRSIYCFAILANCWLWMQAVHEFGHVLAAWLSGGRVRLAYLVPWDISRTDYVADQYELSIVWAGPIVGAALPVTIWLAMRLLRSSHEPLAAFFAGFCLIANGAYLGAAILTPVGDAAEILQLGGSLWMLALFGVICLPLGVWLWNGRGGYFGFGAGAQEVTPQAAAIAAGWLATTIFVETLCYFALVA